MANSLATLIERCNVNKTAANILELLLHEGTMGATHISKISGIKRPTVYAALEGLLLMGLVIKERRSGKTVFSPIERKLIPAVLEKEALGRYEQIKSVSALMQQTLKELPVVPERKIGSYDIRSVESSKAIIDQLLEALLSGNFVAIFNPQLIPKSTMKVIWSQFLKESAKTSPHIREIAVAGPGTDIYKSLIENKNHHLKYLPRGTDIRSDIIMYDGNVVITHHDSGKEMSLRIREERLYASLRTVFELLWAKL